MIDIDDLGDRMKAYEAEETSRKVSPTLPMYARIDGRAFSTFTRDMAKPFDMAMLSAMAWTTRALVEKTHARIGYTQSDEISLVWAPDGETLFGGKVHKLTSILASFATSALMRAIHDSWPADRALDLSSRLPHFDARVFSLPSRTEAANAILWRAMDAKKNAVSSAARTMFSAKKLHGKNQHDMREMMRGEGIDFDTRYPADFRFGSFWRRRTASRELTADELSKIPEKHRPTGPVLRSSIVKVEMTDYFHRIANREAVIFDGAEPAAPRTCR